jgi:hypothetical protein
MAIIDSGRDWVAASADALRDLGFTLLHSDRPAADDGSQLLVALRDRPTLRHFDPEQVTCWVAASGRGRAVPIDRHTPPGERSILWGHVASGQAGGGEPFPDVRRATPIADVDPGSASSARPPGRWSGAATPRVSMPGRRDRGVLRPADRARRLPGRRRVSPGRRAPEHLYAAFLRDTAARRRRRPRLDRIATSLRSWINAETARIRGAHPAWWEAAGILLDDLNLGPEGFATERAAGTMPPSRSGA